MKKEIVRNTDYQKEERPETRFKQFFDIFFHRFVELLKLSLLQAVFNMPLVVSLVLFHQLVRSSTSMGSLMTVFLIQGGSLLISMPSVFVGLTGVFYCFKKIIHSDGEYASSSFFIGMREEWKNGLLIGLIAGFSFALTIIGCFYFYYYVPSFNTVIAGFGIAILIIQALIILMVCYYSIGQVVFYKNPLRFVLKNSFIMTLIRFPINLLLTIIHPGILVALFVIMDITMYVGIVLLIFLVGIGHLIWNLNVISAFDKYINKENYKDIYLKGLSTYNKEE